jgi:hypothetical protein
MNRIKSFLVMAVFTATVFTFIGCGVAKNGSLSKGLPERFFTDSKIEIDDSKNVSYAFESKLADPFPLDKIWMGTVFIDLNPSFESVLKYYMNSKYAVAGSSGGDYHVDIILEKCSHGGEAAGTEKARGGYTTGGGVTVSVDNMKVTSEITIKVRVNVGGNVSEREIMAMGEFTGNESDWSTITRSFDLAIRGAISRMDRFLNSTIGTATPDP